MDNKNNSGNRNSGDWNSGYFNIDKPKIRIFGKETDIKIEDIDFPNYLFFDLIEWIEIDDMTKKSIKLLQDKNILGNDFRKWEV